MLVCQFLFDMSPSSELILVLEQSAKRHDTLSIRSHLTFQLKRRRPLYPGKAIRMFRVLDFVKSSYHTILMLLKAALYE